MSDNGTSISALRWEITMNLASILVVYFAIMGSVLLILEVLSMVARWSIFKKCSISGWKALIPIYSGYLFYRISWRGKYFWIFLVMTVSAIISGNLAENNIIMTMIYEITFVIAVIFYIIQSIMLALKFDHSMLFGLGIVVFNIIFLFIIAFGDSEYKGNPIEGFFPEKRGEIPPSDNDNITA